MEKREHERGARGARGAHQRIVVLYSAAVHYELAGQVRCKMEVAIARCHNQWPLNQGQMMIHSFCLFTLFSTFLLTPNQRSHQLYLSLTFVLNPISRTLPVSCLPFVVQSSALILPLHLTQSACLCIYFNILFNHLIPSASHHIISPH